MAIRKIDYYARKAVRGEDEIIVGAIDVETAGLGGKLLMVQWGINGGTGIHYATGPDMLDKLFADVFDWPSPAVWYSHFAQYDWRYFMEYFLERNLEIEIGMRTDTDIYEIRIITEDGKIVLRDSYALWPSTLENLAKQFCPEIPKLEIDVANFDPENPEHIEYAKRDIQILLLGLPNLFDMCNELFEINPGPTTAGTALKAWQRSLGKEEIYNSSVYGAQELFIRSAYYGGLVFLTDTAVIKDAETYDINSSYPASMDEYGVPYGRTYETTEYQSGQMGIYRCRVRAPDNLIVPILPARNARGGMRWYCGEFETVVTSIELIFAAKHGYEILEIYEGLAFEEVVYPFSDFIGHCKMLRQEFKGQAVEALAKLMQNSLYGKFGSRRERLRMISALSTEEDELIGATPYDDNGFWYVKKELDTEMRCLPEWSVFITAHSRLRLLSQIYKIGPENVIYGDTDSITLRPGFGHMVDVGDEYGQFKLEKTWRQFRAIAPKVYTGILDDGTFKGAAKGLPRKGITDKNWKELLQDGRSEAVAWSLQSLRVALKTGKVRKAHELTRKSSSLENSSNFVALPDGKIRLKSQHEN